MTLDEVCDAIIKLLPLSENNLGFVSPTHFTLQMVSVVEELRRRGYNPTILYNTNGYDLPETLRTLEGIVDVWLPDLKYSDDRLAEVLSQAPHYIEYALAALKEMVRQVGTTLHTDDRGIARRGIIIRHLVLPGQEENSIGVLKLIAENFSSKLHISLMSQYYPPDKLLARNIKFETATQEKSRTRSVGKQDQSRTRTYPDEVGSVGTKIEDRKFLHRTVSSQEYKAVIESFHDLGFSHGWLQDYRSHKIYRPDFSKKNPFNL